MHGLFSVRVALRCNLYICSLEGNVPKTSGKDSGPSKDHGPANDPEIVILDGPDRLAVLLSVMERTLGLRLLPFTLSTGDVYTLKIKKIGYKDNYLPSVFDLEGDAWKPGEDTSLFPPTKFVCTYNTQSHRGQVKGELSARHPE